MIKLIPKAYIINGNIIKIVLSYLENTSLELYVG